MASFSAEKKTLRIVISGYFGFHNLGDEAILEAVCEQLWAIESDLEVIALGQAVKSQHDPRLHYVSRVSPPLIWQALRRADLLISGGGSLLQDVTGPASVPYYLGILELARLAGVPRMVFAQGVGPLKSFWSRRMVGGVLSRVDSITVRDPASRDLLIECGLRSKEISLTVDPVLASKPQAADLTDALWEQWGLNRVRPVVAVSIRPWPAWLEKQLKAFSAVLAQCARAWDAQILLLPFHKPGDDWLLEELSHCLAARPEGQKPVVVMAKQALTAKEMLGVLGRVDLLIGMRLHALIMAAAASTPAIGIIYDPKIEAFARLANLPTIPSVESLADSAELQSALHQAWARRGALRSHLQSLRAAWTEAAMKNSQLAVDIARRSRAT
ncbi:MAG: polysaccharide pyruvyl transferase CsaB [Candidatus Sericytochromatia bacterium]|nr:polysaccharide pyruvyl transferase CsaB [Candidatus Sericytochromatia bacterium]